MLSRSNGLARAQNKEIQIDGVHCSRCLSRYYRHDKGNFTTTIQSRTNEKKNNINVLPFSRVGKSKSCCFICKHKNIDLVTVPAKPRVTLFCSMAFLYRWASFFFFCKHHLFNCLNSHILKHYIIVLAVSVNKICLLTCSCLLRCKSLKIIIGGFFMDFIVPLENFSLIWRRHHCRWRAASFDLCSALMAIEQWGFFNVPHLLRHGLTVYCGHLRGLKLIT